MPKPPVIYPPGLGQRNVARLAESIVEKHHASIEAKAHRDTRLLLRIEEAVREGMLKAVEAGFKPAEVEARALKMREQLRADFGLPPVVAEVDQ